MWVLGTLRCIEVKHAQSMEPVDFPPLNLLRLFFSIFFWGICVNNNDNKKNPRNNINENVSV